MVFTKILHKMLKQDLTLQILNTSNLNLKIIQTVQEQLNFVELRAKTCSYLMDDGSKDKTQKSTKKFVVKRKLKFENYKNYSEGTQLENEINYLEKK